jgi:hypothetical protein
LVGLAHLRVGSLSDFGPRSKECALVASLSALPLGRPCSSPLLCSSISSLSLICCSWSRLPPKPLSSPVLSPVFSPTGAIGFFSSEVTPLTGLLRQLLLGPLHRRHLGASARPWPLVSHRSTPQSVSLVGCIAADVFFALLTVSCVFCCIFHGRLGLNLNCTGPSFSSCQLRQIQSRGVRVTTVPRSHFAFPRRA